MWRSPASTNSIDYTRGRVLFYVYVNSVYSTRTFCLSRARVSVRPAAFDEQARHSAGMDEAFFPPPFTLTRVYIPTGMSGGLPTAHTHTHTLRDHEEHEQSHNRRHNHPRSASTGSRSSDKDTDDKGARIQVLHVSSSRVLARALERERF